MKALQRSLDLLLAWSVNLFLNSLVTSNAEQLGQRRKVKRSWRIHGERHGQNLVRCLERSTKADIADAFEAIADDLASWR